MSIFTPARRVLFVPTAAGGDQTVVLSALSLSLTLNDPTVISSPIVEPSALTLCLSLNAPTVKPDIAVTLTALGLTLTLNAPTVNTGIIVLPSALALSLTLNAPTVISSPTVSVTALALTLTLNAPTVITGEVTVEISVLALSLGLQEPSVVIVNKHTTYKGITPVSDGDLDLGGSGLRWKDGYFVGLILSLPVADPSEAGRLWNDSGVVKISSG